MRGKLLAYLVSIIGEGRLPAQKRLAGGISGSLALTLQPASRTITDGILGQEAHRGQTA
jgi:hypothetical protein